MIHNNEVLGTVINVASQLVETNKDLTLYIVQNVYGKIIIYVDTTQKELVYDVEAEMMKKIDTWLSTCELYEDNFFAQSQIEQWKKNSVPVKERIWVFEKYITNIYWDSKKAKKEKKYNVK